MKVKECAVEKGCFYCEFKEGRVVLRPSENGFNFKMEKFFQPNVNRVYTLTGHVKSVSEFQKITTSEPNDILRILDNEGNR